MSAGELERIEGEQLLPIMAREDFLGIRGARLTKTGLELPTDLPFGEYQKILGALADVRNTTAWAIGEAIRFGERVYGETYAQAAETTKLSERTLQNYAWVAGRIPPSRRRADLSFTHHLLVASLGFDARERWLELAEADGLSAGVLRERIQEERKKFLPARDLPPAPVSETGGRDDRRCPEFDEIKAEIKQRLYPCYGPVEVEIWVAPEGPRS